MYVNVTINHIIGTAVKATLGGKAVHSFTPRFYSLQTLWQSMLLSISETEGKFLCRSSIRELVETVLSGADSWLRKSDVSEEIRKFLKERYPDDKVSLNNFVHGFITWRLGKSFSSAIYRHRSCLLCSDGVISDVISALGAEPGKIEMQSFLDLYWLYHP